MGLWLIAAGANGFVAIAMGAFAAHGLRTELDAGALAWIETGSRYQMWHALALLGVALLMTQVAPGRQQQLLRAVAWAFFAGSILFAGSLYMLALTQLRLFAWFTPFGGVFLMAGWLGLAALGLLRWRATDNS